MGENPSPSEEETHSAREQALHLVEHWQSREYARTESRGAVDDVAMTIAGIKPAALIGQPERYGSEAPVLKELIDLSKERGLIIKETSLQTIAIGRGENVDWICKATALGKGQSQDIVIGLALGYSASEVMAYVASVAEANQARDQGCDQETISQRARVAYETEKNAWEQDPRGEASSGQAAEGRISQAYNDVESNYRSLNPTPDPEAEKLPDKK